MSMFTPGRTQSSGFSPSGLIVDVRETGSGGTWAMPFMEVNSTNPGPDTLASVTPSSFPSGDVFVGGHIFVRGSSTGLDQSLVRVKRNTTVLWELYVEINSLYDRRYSFGFFSTTDPTDTWVLEVQYDGSGKTQAAGCLWLYRPGYIVGNAGPTSGGADITSGLNDNAGENPGLGVITLTKMPQRRGNLGCAVFYGLRQSEADDQYRVKLVFDGTTYASQDTTPGALSQWGILVYERPPATDSPEVRVDTQQIGTGTANDKFIAQLQIVEWRE